MDPGFPSTVRPIDGTQIRNQVQTVEEHGYVDRNLCACLFLCAGEIIDALETERFVSLSLLTIGNYFQCSAWLQRVAALCAQQVLCV